MTTNEPITSTSTSAGYKRPMRYIFDAADHQEFMKSKVCIHFVFL